MGIGTENPSVKLEVNGKIKTTSLQIPDPAPDGSSDEIEGFVLMSSDNSGNAGWRSQSSIDDGDWTKDGGDIYRIDGNVGIGTENPPGLLSLYKDNPSENLGISIQNGASTRYWIGHGSDNVFVVFAI